jgi:putative Holliday junction resolvase
MSTERILLSFDFGMKRIGVAVGQRITKTANPLTTLAAKAGEPDWHQVDALVKKWRPDAFIVGIPLNMDGTDQPMTHAARHFTQSLIKHYALPTHEVDERLTTKAAREALFEAGGYKALQSGEVDQFAAKILLENWFLRFP